MSLSSDHAQALLPRLGSPLISKRCIVCGERKPLGEYNRNRAHKDGRKNRCRACSAAYDRAYYAAHKEEDNAKSRAYYVEHMEEKRAQSRVYNETHKEERAAYRETHKNEIAIYGRAYRQTPRGRAVMKACRARRRLLPNVSDLAADTIQEVLDASNGICPYCGEPFEDGHVDHVIPVSKGGTNDRENLVYVCAQCNLSKGNMGLLEFMLRECSRAT